MSTPPADAPKRHFLFLQGLATRFFSRLGAALIARGHGVTRVNFNGGDKVFWRLPGAIDFRDAIEAWPAALTALLEQRGITDIVLFGDCRPHHRIAVELANRRGIPVHVFEEGYLRPCWITHEVGGVNAFSPLPRDPAWYLGVAPSLPPFADAPPVPGTFLRRATEDVVYNVSTSLLAWRFHGYRTHRPVHPFVEYAGWLWKFAQGPITRRRAERAMRAVADLAGRYYLLPLQLDSDFQIREHSPFGRLEPALQRIIQSFARFAPKDTRMVVKAHPLDNGLTNWRRMIMRIAAEHGVAERIVYLDDGELVALLRGSRGVVTINSTVGTVALGEGCPVIALGTAIYDLPGMTFQGELDDFWTQGQPADPALFDAFRRVLVARTLIPGGFFSEEALAASVRGAIAKLEAVTVPLAQARGSAAGTRANATGSDSDLARLRAAATGI